MQLTHSEIVQVQTLSEGLSQEEVFAYMGWDISQFEDPEFEQSFKKAFNQGRAQFKLHAVQKLKEAMSGKTGLQASLAVLTRFADEWPDTGSDPNPGVQRSFRVVLDE